jgi:hypothetical protein
MPKGATEVKIMTTAVVNRLRFRLDRRKGINKMGIIAIDSHGRKLIAIQIITNGTINTLADL